MAGKVVLVTGASRGIGRGIAERLRADGWQIETAERPTGVDLADPEQARAAVERLDRIDALVANAGVIVRKSVLEHTIEDWRHVLDVNLVSVFALAQAAARRMVEAGGGAIVLMASQLSYFGGMNAAAYAASKGGVAQLTKALSNELAGQGVRVNAGCAGVHRDRHDRRHRGLEAPRGRRAHPDRPLGHARGRRPRRRLAALRRRRLRHRRDRAGGRRLSRALTSRLGS